MEVYSAFNKDVFSNIPLHALSILDVGCGTGAMGAALKEQNSNRKVYGITYSQVESASAGKLMDKVLVCDINKEMPQIDCSFDCIIFSHVLEHTTHPDKILSYFKKYLNKEGIVIVALPNILFYKQRWQLLKGNFRYSKEGGLMDDTHYKFFDNNTAKELLEEAGYSIVLQYATGNIPIGLLRKGIPALSKRIDSFFVKRFPGLFGFQFILVGKGKS
jgi:2-polyprenyl-3-methyl-5-hydroxy-6-metoxy-1,4-benzoquinol methylase